MSDEALYKAAYEAQKQENERLQSQMNAIVKTILPLVDAGKHIQRLDPSWRWLDQEIDHIHRRPRITYAMLSRLYVLVVENPTPASSESAQS